MFIVNGCSSKKFSILILIFFAKNSFIIEINFASELQSYQMYRCNQSAEAHCGTQPRKIERLSYFRVTETIAFEICMNFSSEIGSDHVHYPFEHLICCYAVIWDDPHMPFTIPH